NGIGPYDAAAGLRNQVGGTTYFNASAEVQFPMPAIPESFGLRGAFFADAATLYGAKLASPSVGPAVDLRGTEMKWRASAGASLIWASPFGPLRVDYAVPLIEQDGDVVQNFNFGMSTRF